MRLCRTFFLLSKNKNKKRMYSVRFLDFPSREGNSLVMSILRLFLHSLSVWGVVHDTILNHNLITVFCWWSKQEKTFDKRKQIQHVKANLRACKPNLKWLLNTKIWKEKQSNYQSWMKSFLGRGHGTPKINQVWQRSKI